MGPERLYGRPADPSVESVARVGHPEPSGQAGCSGGDGADELLAKAVASIGGVDEEIVGVVEINELPAHAVLEGHASERTGHSPSVNDQVARSAVRPEGVALGDPEERSFPPRSRFGVVDSGPELTHGGQVCGGVQPVFEGRHAVSFEDQWRRHYNSPWLGVSMCLPGCPP